MDTGLMYGEYIPVVILSIITFMLIEAGSNVDDDTMTKLPGKYTNTVDLSQTCIQQ